MTIKDLFDRLGAVPGVKDFRLVVTFTRRGGAPMVAYTFKPGHEGYAHETDASTAALLLETVIEATDPKPEQEKIEEAGPAPVPALSI